MKIGTAIAVVAITTAGAHAQTTPKADPAKGQKIAAQVCVACHGADGNSSAPANPHLAGQHAEYIAKQLRDYKANKERKNPVMMGMATPLTPEDMRDVAAYYSIQKPKPGAAKDKELVVLGQKLYRGGNPATGVPACASCHGPNGSGIPAQYPRLAGQFAEYTAAQLRLFRSEERANDLNRMMRGAAARMTDREILAVSEYLAGLR